jgi:hypothetical protein
MTDSRRNFLAFVLLIALPFVFFWQITLGQGVWFGNDIVRTYHPLGAELSRALNEGRLPLWTPGMYGGFPILADAQIAALYPVNWLLFRFMPAPVALACSMLLHLAWAAAGMFLLARAFGLRTAGAFLAGFIFAFNGFMFSRLEHASVLITSAWLPWSLFFYEQFQCARAQKSNRAGIWFASTAVALAAPFLTGFPQVAFMIALTFGTLAFLGTWLWHSPTVDREVVKVLAPIILAGILAAGVVAAQLVPTAELVGFSTRGGGASFEFATSYSLPVDFLPQFIFPFLRGEPSEGANNEYWAYLGIAPFLLTILAPFLRRDRRTIFVTLFSLIALSLALGEVNPVYRLIYQLPGFNFFRVPARYLLLFVFGAALLAGIGIDEISNRLAANDRNWKRDALFILGFGAALLLILLLGSTQPLEFWLSAWQVLPFVFLTATVVILIFMRTRRIDLSIFQTSIIGLTMIDLACAALMFVLTLGQIVTPDYASVVPRSLTILRESPGRARVFADQYIFPSTPAIRGSLYPNTALVYDAESADAYSSLGSLRHSKYLGNLSPAMLNAMNVKYWTIPLEPRPRTKIAFPAHVVAIDVLNNEEFFAPTPATAIEITSFTENAEQLADGAPVGQIEIRRRDGRVEAFPLRVGIETADWDYARKSPQHQRASIANSFPGFWRSFGRPFDGHTYVARVSFAPGEIIGVNVRVIAPDARLTIEGITLYNASGRAVSLASLVGKNDFRVAYFSDTVAAWENLDVLPRAFIVHSAEIVNDDVAFERLHDPAFDPARVVLLADGAPIDGRDAARDAVELIDYQPERVEFSATTDQPGYLFFGDSWFPGWSVSVDGKAATLHRANILFRAVPLAPGTHSIVFEYRPLSFIAGAVISLTSLVILVSIAIYLGTVKTR